MEEQTEIQLTAQVAIRVAGLAERLDVANKIMAEVMQVYSKVCQEEQSKMDLFLASICSANDIELPQPYEYKLDLKHMTITVRKKEDAGSLRVALATP